MTGARVLYADDDRGLARLVELSLSDSGLTMEWAESGEAALALLAHGGYDVVVLDYRMPGLDGLEVLARMAALGPLPPTIMISGVGGLEVAVEAMRLGAADYVVKDMGGSYLDLLPAAIGRVLDKQRLLAERAEAERRAVEQSLLLSTTLDTISQGLCVFDAELRLKVWNQRYLDLYDFPAALARPGTPLAEFLRFSALAGDYGEGDREAMVARRLERARESVTHAYERTRPDGTVIEVRGAPMPGGGFVSTHTDITERKRLESRVVRTLAELEAVFDNSLVGICLLLDRTFVRVNSRLCEMFGYDRDELLGQTTTKLYPSPAEYAAFGAAARPCLRSGLHYHHERLMRRRDGSLFFCEFLGRALDPARPEAGVIWNLQDITARKQAEERQQMAAAVFDAASEAIMITDPRPRIQAVNPAFTAVTGYTAAEVIGQDPRMLGSGRQDEAFYQELLSTLSQAGAWQGEVWNRRKDGAFYAVRLSLAAVRGENGPASHFVGIFHDITLRKEDEARAWNRANYDALTGLPNRALLLDRLEQTLSRADRGKDGLAVVFLDLDGFKAVNDSLGHARGDLLLQQVARRLQTCVRAADTVARLAGDEFVAILDQLREPADAIKVARKMLAAMAEPFDLDGDSASVSASIGIAFYPADGDDPLDLLERADVAMYRVKRAGKGAVALADAEA